VISTKDYIDQAHERVKKMQRDKMSDEEIIAVLQSEGMTEYYARTLIENVESDRHSRKGFWQLVIAGIGAIAAGAFLLFNDFGTGFIFIGLVGACFVGGITMILRAYIIFRK